MPAKIIIGADLVPTESNYNYFKGCETEYLIGKKITEKLNNADFTIFNLEVSDCNFAGYHAFRQLGHSQQKHCSPPSILRRE